ncbi:G1 family glutamic endopeptidase [Actinacidiphila sp. bgisy144]|uniref:G1 family glutamic endopeptidase n=1 Tax=unclassified Actinacidiphila TaxID=2995708 RepID=UPI003EB6B486
MRTSRVPLLLSVLAVPAVLALAAPAASATTVQGSRTAAAASQVGGDHAVQVHRGSRSTSYSGNWSGYAAANGNGGDTQVSSSWVQPAVDCTVTPSGMSSFWVGLDGWTNDALEQTGTEADCVNGQASYYAWWEVLPANQSLFSGVTVAPGDRLSADVVDNGNGTFTMTLADATRGWTRTKTAAGSSNRQDNSAEIIAEATSNYGVIQPLPDFRTVTFTDATVNDKGIAGSSPFGITMRNNDSRDITAVPGSLSGGSFPVTWRQED